MVRRLHIYCPAGTIQARCPDCNARLVDVGEVKGGAVVERWCPRCKDDSGQKKRITIVLHSDFKKYKDAIENEMRKIEIEGDNDGEHS
jgi:phage FluMu protein Com